MMIRSVILEVLRVVAVRSNSHSVRLVSNSVSHSRSIEGSGSRSNSRCTSKRTSNSVARKPPAIRVTMAESGNEDSDTFGEKFYTDAQEYWKQIPATISGMLGGHQNISARELDGSKQFLYKLLPKGKDAKNYRCRALDCGSGIGRITKSLLLGIFETVDMVEQDSKFLEESTKYIGADACRVGNMFNEGLQNFTPAEKSYDVIWCQWVLGHLSDDDLVTFFQRCKVGIKNSGYIIVKENITNTDVIFDDVDSSIIRPDSDFKNVFTKSGLTIIKESVQRGLPRALFAVKMYALK